MTGMEPTQLQAVRGRVVTRDELLADGLVVWSHDTLVYVGPADEAPQGHQELPLHNDPAAGNYILPGLVDVHSHGGGGASIPDIKDPQTAITALTEHRRHGTTSYVASLVTAGPESLRESVKVLAPLVHADELAGIHFEGPFISVDRCGAQDPTLIQAPNPELTAELLELAGGAGATMTIAAEKEGNVGPGSVADVLISGGALPSFGHTDASGGETRRGLAYAYERLREEPNARSRRPTVTHLFNGMRPLSHREVGPIPDCLAAAARGEAVVELVADGVHVHPTLVTEVFELVGRENIALVTDAMAAAGMPDGSYELGSMRVTVADGVARLTEGGAIAGGTARLIDVVRTTAAGGVNLVDAVYSASVTGAAVLGREDVGSLTVGKRADVVLTDADLLVQHVWRGGKQVD